MTEAQIEVIIRSLKQVHDENTLEELEDLMFEGYTEERARLENMDSFEGPADFEVSRPNRELMGRTQDWVEAFDDGLGEAAKKVFRDDGDVGDLMEIVNNDGVRIDRRGEMELVKNVDADGNATYREKEIDYVLLLEPSSFFNWITQSTGMEARNFGYDMLHEDVEQIDRQMWLNPLDENTEPISARLHGMTFEKGELPFLPPIWSGDRSRIWPIFAEDTVTRERQRNPEFYQRQRQEWFVNYHRMQRGQLPEESFTEASVDLDEWDLDFIYSQYLPQDVHEYRIAQGGDDNAE